ncbi:hypothetical protein [Sulfitobacter sabulilitoris]|uniref:Uncharacterized protein n=1 Tax=Sulfitobacter sabulilitoris TaxID=2562655 RepID=A0A5S3QD18_9RHOB|nr:hypothetical protein [Sulfitobacter sabulilitoris]TMM55032.1 hypothetical protein FDT80_05520 [Sulfitobacter sabulilitoris]
MVFSQILAGLQALDATGAQADQAARQGFLEWVFSLDGCPHPAARDALDRVPQDMTLEPAARAFVGFLRQAAQPQTPPFRRGGAAGRRLRLH